MALEIRVLGGFETRLDGVLLDLPTRKTRALLAHLALTAGKAHSRERLTALLWGDRPETQARQSFRQALAGLRRVLGPIGAQILRADDRHVTLDQSAVVIDAAEFEWLAAQPDTGALERAADLYRGDLLDGLEVDEAPFQEWLGTERERLRELHLEVLVRLLGAQMRADATQAAIRTAQRVLAADPLQESVHRALMRLYVRHGQRSAALRQYHVCVTAVRRELGVEPEPETQVLYREVLTSAASAMARGDDAGHRAGLTTPADPLVGRGAEMAWMRRALDAAWDGAPAVAILAGEAGVGKTRLIEELAAEAAQLGGTVLVGRGYESERLLPLRVWVDALRSSPAIAAADPAGSIPAAERAEAARVLPELGGELLPAPGGPHDVVRLFEALTGLLVDAAGRRPLLVVLEDLHVADELTVRLLAFLARRVRGVPLLLVGTLRDEDAAGEEVGRVLAQLERDNHASRLTLRPLAQPDCVTLATTLAHRRDPGLQTRLAEHVWRLSEGNPFVIVETVRALDAAGEAALPRLPRS
ncbi:MAG TPA: BTAD domain-containing putative transcriptional regulator, partial [Candidatus Tectomicrobia bacterium]|nr:BTAD domain-containing putative transcriptional regulator [Candidatus Tectomicrobia bacterium]